MKAHNMEALAQAIKENLVPIIRNEEDLTKVYNVNQFIVSLCDILKAENKNFNKSKFMEACK